jgi:hypothetical protein
MSGMIAKVHPEQKVETEEIKGLLVNMDEAPLLL